VLHIGLPALHFIKLDAQGIEDAAYARMVSQHHATHLVLGLNVGTLLGKGHLNRGRSPWDKVGQLALTDTLQ
jgi:hypothetical protein